MELSRTTWYNMNYRAHFVALVESVFTDRGLGIGEIPQSLLYYSTKTAMLSEPSLRIVW